MHAKNSFSTNRATLKMFQTHACQTILLTVVRTWHIWLSNDKLNTEAQTDYILGMLIVTFSPRRSRMFRVNVLQWHNKNNLLQALPLSLFLANTGTNSGSHSTDFPSENTPRDNYGFRQFLVSSITIMIYTPKHKHFHFKNNKMNNKNPIQII